MQVEWSGTASMSSRRRGSWGGQAADRRCCCVGATGPAAPVTSASADSPPDCGRGLRLRACGCWVLHEGGRGRILSILLVVLAAVGRAAAQDYDFFYLVLQWPGSYCDTKQSCCYPTSGKPPADFGIHGLWPNRDDGTYPQNCSPDNAFNPSKVSDLQSSMRTKWPTLACPSGDGLKFWGHEWEKHGTCAENIFDEHGYFQAALRLRDQLGVLAALTSAGVNPDGGYYTLSQIKGAIQEGTGFEPYVECNRDESGNSQLYQLYFCVNAAGDSFVDCPVSPGGRPCGNRIEFPAF